jgi:hypothetical protein
MVAHAGASGVMRMRNPIGPSRAINQPALMLMLMRMLQLREGE